MRWGGVGQGHHSGIENSMKGRADSAEGEMKIEKVGGDFAGQQAGQSRQIKLKRRRDGLGPRAQ